MSSARAWRIGALVCLVLVIGILLITLTPTPIDRPYRTLVAQIVSATRALPGLGWFDYSALERTSNALMFAPLGAVLTALTRRWWLAVLIALVLSAGVELAQAEFLPERTASLSDVIANTSGAVVGALVVVVVRALKRSRSARRGSRSDAPG